MNPSSNETAGGQLPVHIGEQVPLAEAPAEAALEAAEQAPAIAESAAGVTAPASAVPALIPLPTPSGLPAAAPPDDVSATTQAGGLQIADDGDLIEKEWVNKAKAIVERTREDPHKQNEELTVFKADYMQKRYNKTVKLNK